MAEELVVSNGNRPQNQEKGDFSNYKPLELNLGVFWSTKVLGDKTSLSFNYLRDYIKFTFNMVTNDGKKETVSKKFKLSEGYRIANALRTILADRIATLNTFVESGAEGVPQYSVYPEEAFEFKAHYYDKEKGEDVTTGKITISTVEVNGVNRICIKGYSDTEMLQIRVVFYDDFNDKISKVSAKSVADGGDLDFYRLVLEVEQSLKKTFEYAAADKIYQAIIHRGSGNSFNNNNNFKEKKFGFFNKNTQRQISVNDSQANDSVAGIDLFDQDDDPTF